MQTILAICMCDKKSFKFKLNSAQALLAEN